METNDKQLKTDNQLPTEKPLSAFSSDEELIKFFDGGTEDYIAGSYADENHVTSATPDAQTPLTQTTGTGSIFEKQEEVKNTEDIIEDNNASDAAEDGGGSNDDEVATTSSDEKSEVNNDDSSTPIAVEHDSESFVDYERLEAVGLGSTDAILELKAAFDASREAEKKYEEKSELTYLLEAEGIDSVKELALAIKALKGDKNAIANLLDNNKIDSVDLVLDDTEKEEFSYDFKKIEELRVKDDANKLFNQNISIATSVGVDKDSFLDKLSTWDEASRVDILSDSKNSSIIANEMKSGNFDNVMNEVKKIRESDYLGKYKNVDTFDLYKMAHSNLSSTAPKQKSDNVVTEQKKDIISEKEIIETIENKSREDSAKEASVGSSLPKGSLNQSGRGSLSAFKDDEELFAYFDEQQY